MEIPVEFSLMSIMFSFFQVSKNDFIIGLHVYSVHTYFTHTTASRTVIDDVTNMVTHRIFNIKL